MGLRINQNIAAMNAYRNLSTTDGQMAKSLEKLSSGFRINRAADDAAGLSISEGLRSQIKGLNMAVKNAQDGISVVQTAEGALTETHSILQRMRELAVQASNDGGVDDTAKAQIQSEITELAEELDRIADTTRFGTTKLLDGAYDKSFQIGANAGETLDVAIASGTATEGFDSASLGIGTGFSVANFASAQAAITSLDAAIGEVSTARSGLGATQNRLEHTIANLSVASENIAASESRIRDTDMAKEMVEFTRAQILQQAGTAMLAQANQAPQGVLQLLG